MFKNTRALWMANKAISDALYAEGIRDTRVPNQIISPHLTVPGELQFMDYMNIYRQRPARDAAIMTLIQISAFWKKHSRSEACLDRSKSERYHHLSIEAATALAKKEWYNETNHRELVLQLIDKDTE